jgi:hypothetical protein
LIVRKSSPAWEIIFQPAHALLAGKIAQELLSDVHCTAWFETLLAIAIHDDHPEQFLAGKTEYVTESGAPKDFTEMEMSDDLRLREAILCVANAYRKSQWIGLLRSYHTHVLYSSEEISVPFQQFLEDETERRRTIMRHIGVKKAELEHAYEVMQWCDRCSLILCQSELPAMHRKLEISMMQKQRYDIWQRDDQSICVEPWPFTSQSFTLQVEKYSLATLAFADDAELGKALDSVPANYDSFLFRSK